jgi:hypothetical protein
MRAASPRCFIFIRLERSAAAADGRLGGIVHQVGLSRPLSLPPEPRVMRGAGGFFYVQ